MKIAILVREETLQRCSGKAPNYETLGNHLGEYFDVIGYTHGGEQGAERETVMLQKGFFASEK